MELLTLEIKSRFGSFTKPTSTTGGLLTYKIPPKPAIKGMIGAISGFSFEETHKYLENLKIGVKPLRETKTKTTTFNSHYGNPRGRMVNIKQELLIEPHYQVFLDFSEIKKDENAIQKITRNFKEIFDNTPESLSEAVTKLCQTKNTYYIPYMGRNNFPLEYNTLDIDLQKIDKPITAEMKIHSVIPKEICSNFRIQETEEDTGGFGFNLSVPDNLKIHILKDMPTDQKPNREYRELKDFILAPPSKNMELYIQPKQPQKQYTFFKTPEDRLITLY
ncbi:CRISPR-associated protein Cas5 [Methanonatronarchaeum sp. AMET6-2]|uniref:CRISPR-associated protein Cas5 n=1 Tax=Methanonatronarchaeum sp. AMET6-2 TaxID=2933293 RepID=UPI00122B55E9|nr:CRISPR-associated protein Cas5 [Methanonatronarchaeum sp. AMET6-2]RZN63108.1 MAG: CRISPR-associated protein Cas5 [Methanonatronarchaeia archaeon]UOY10063.1 CRISPR-associated protein Cas5 [Methanonatronarchaeum sp. AMET6-2]